MAGTRWWRRDETDPDPDVWGGPDEVTLAPAPRSAPDDDVARDAAEREARELAEREAAEQAEREAREQADREAAEQAEREAREQAEREAAEQAEREAAERAEREAREQAEREAREQADREAREQADREAREQADREAREQADREAREQADREAREQAEREAREQADREAREQAEREAREQAEREAREQADREAREQAEREARERVEQERVSTLPGAEAVSPSVARESAAREEAAREAAAADRKRRRRRVLVVFAAAVVAVAAVWIVPRLIALGLSFLTVLGVVSPAETPSILDATPVAAADAGPVVRPELPRGGSAVAPAHRVVLARGTPDGVEAAAAPFDTADRPVLPALELPVAGIDETPAVWQRLADTRAHRQLLVLAVPTGPVGVRDALAPWERLLREPDVGLALAAPLAPPELAAATSWLAGLVRDANLPQKLLVVPSATGPAPGELAVVATDGAAAPPVLRGVVLAPGGPGPRAVLAATPSPDVLLRR
ncbi:hypothetical protein ACR9E3_15395 [Actinomycetospora sp. C-140]